MDDSALAEERLAANRALISHEDFDDVTLLATSADASDRQLAGAVLYKTRLRQAVDALGALVEAQGYQSQNEINLLMQLSALSGNELHLIKAFKAIGLRATSAGQFEDAMRHLETAQGKAGHVMMRYDRRSRLATNFLFDQEIDSAYAYLASLISYSRAPAPHGERLKCALIVSGVVEENSATVFGLAVCEGLRKAGMDARVISTAHAQAPGVLAEQQYREAGFRVDIAPRGTYEQRLSFICDSLFRDPADVAIYMTYPMDNVAKVIACMQPVQTQVYLMIGIPPLCANYDSIIYINTCEYNASPEPQKRFAGNGAALGPSVDAAKPVGRKALGIPEGGVLFGTVGRLAKIVSGGFVDATIDLLKAEPTALFAIAGPAYEGEAAFLETVYRAAGVRDRVFLLGKRQHDVAGILKTFDVYLDTFPWSGGQSSLEAMHSGRPIVAMGSYSFPEFNTRIQLCDSEHRFQPVVEIAKPDDPADYVRLARAYAGSPALRERDGAAILERAKTDFSLENALANIAAFVKEAAS